MAAMLRHGLHIICSLVLLLATSHSVFGQQSTDLSCVDWIELKGVTYKAKIDGKKVNLQQLKCFPDYLLLRKKNLWAIYKPSGEAVTDFIYQEIRPFDRGLAQVRLGDARGYINQQGKSIIPIEFEKIRELSATRILARKMGHWFLYDQNGKQLNGEPYDKVSSFYDGYAVVKAGDRFGLIDRRGNIIRDPEFENIHNFFEGLAMVSKDGKWGHMNERGEIIIPLMYDETFVFYNGISIARKEDKWGYIDKKNKILIGFDFDYVEHFNQGRALVSRNGKWGYINPQGKELIPLIYDRISPFQRGKAKVEIDGKQGYIDRNGKSMIDAKYDEIYRFRNGIAIMRKGDQYGFLKENGEELSPAVYEYVSPFIDGVSRVRQNGKYGLINQEAETILPTEFDEIGTFEGGMASVRKGNEWVFVDAIPGQGSIEINPDRAARIRIGDEWGYIDQSGRTYGFSQSNIEFVETRAELGQIQADQDATYTFHFRNNGETDARISHLEAPCACETVQSHARSIRPGEYGQITLRCKTQGRHNDWRVQVPVYFDDMEEPITLGMQAEQHHDLQNAPHYEQVPVNGRYVFLLDISASMDELPLAKMIFSRLAASLCRKDNVSIVSFNSFSRVELRPTVNHSQVVHTIRQLRPSLKTDAARGLRLSYSILREKGRSQEKHIYMASDGDIDSSQLKRILDANDDVDALLTIFVFSYTGDQTAFEDLKENCPFDRVRYVYVDRENISQVLNQEYTDIGCIPPELQADTLRWKFNRISKLQNSKQSIYSDQRRLGLVDELDNIIRPAIYEQIEEQDNGLLKVKINGKWGISTNCDDLTEAVYDSIRNFEDKRALAFRDNQIFILDELGRELDYIPELAENLYYQDPLVLDSEPFVNWTLLLDVSASMNTDQRLPLLKETFKHFSGLLRYEDQIGIVTYTQEARLILESTPAARRRDIIEAVEGLESRGQTALLAGLEMAYDESVQHWIDDGNNRVIIATDGKFEVDEELLDWMDRYRARRLHLTILHFGRKENSEAGRNLKSLSQRAEGSYHFVQARNVAQVFLQEAISKDRLQPAAGGGGSE
jgi:Mg-chelatase subunit ChlD